MNQQGKESRSRVIWLVAMQGASFGFGSGLSGLVLRDTINSNLPSLLFLVGVIMMLLLFISGLLTQAARTSVSGSPSPMKARIVTIVMWLLGGMAIGLLSRSISPGLSFDLPMVYHFLSVVVGAVLGLLLSLTVRTRQVAV